MTDRLQTSDPIEDHLRTLLQDRAASVTGPAPGLPDDPTALRAPDAVVLPHRRPAPWRAALVAAAAAVVAVGLVVVVHGQGPTEQTVHTTQPPSPTAGLPADLDPATAGRVMRINTVRDPEEAARRYLRWRLTEPGATPDEVVAGLRFAAGARDGAVVPVTWSRADGTVGGTVIVRVGEHGSDIVASTAPGVDLSSVRMDADRVTGQARTTGAADQPGPALVDVLFGGHAFPQPVGGRAAAPPTRGYGSAATGDAPFAVSVGDQDPIVSVRHLEDGAVRTISELAFRAPESDGPDPTKMTDEEFDASIRRLPPDPRCTAADEGRPPSLQGGTTSPRSDAPTAVLDQPVASSPEAAVQAFAGAVGLEATDLTLTSPLGNGGVVGAWIGGAPVEAMIWEHDGGFEATEVTTTTACHGTGNGTLTPPGDSDPRTALGFDRLSGPRSGQLWYRTGDGATSTVDLSSEDLRRGGVTVIGEGRTVDALALVARDAEGRVVLVERASL